MEAAKKKVPWAHLEKYLNVHKMAIVTFLDQKKSNLISAEEVEERLPNSFMHLHEVITKILKDNNIIPNENSIKIDLLRLIVTTVLKLLSNIISKNC